MLLRRKTLNCLSAASFKGFPVLELPKHSFAFCDLPGLSLALAFRPDSNPFPVLHSFPFFLFLFLRTKKALAFQQELRLTGSFLSSQGVSTQVLSASECLTTVFGMGTGGSIQVSSPDLLKESCSLKTIQKKKCEHFSSTLVKPSTY